MRTKRPWNGHRERNSGKTSGKTYEKCIKRLLVIGKTPNRLICGISEWIKWENFKFSLATLSPVLHFCFSFWVYFGIFLMKISAFLLIFIKLSTSARHLFTFKLFSFTFQCQNVKFSANFSSPICRSSYFYRIRIDIFLLPPLSFSFSLSCTCKVYQKSPFYSERHIKFK